MNESYYQTFVFDLDGTLLDTIVDMKVCVNRALKKYGLKEHTTDEYKSFVGNGSVKLIQRALGEDNQKYYDDVFSSYYEDYKTHFMDFTKPFDGIVEALEYGKRKGIRYFIYTNKPQAIATEVVEHCFPKGFFEKIIGVPLGGKTKPDPKAFLDEFKKYDDISLDRCAYFGDSDTDILTAKNIGIKNMYSVSWGYKTYDFLVNYECKPKKILRNPSEIKEVIDNII